MYYKLKAIQKNKLINKKLKKKQEKKIVPVFVNPNESV